MSDNTPVALVTGGSAGIGASICQHLLEDGYHVLNLSRRKSELRNDRVTDVEVDLADPAATKRAIDELARQYEITSLVHNAGVIRPDLLRHCRQIWPAVPQQSRSIAADRRHPGVSAAQNQKWLREPVARAGAG